MKSFNKALCTKLITTLVIGISSNPLHAEIYRWVDENGITNYSNMPVKKKVNKKEGDLEIIEYVIRKKPKAEEEESVTETEKSVKAEDKTSKKALEELLSDGAIKQISSTDATPDDKQAKCSQLRKQLAALEEKDFATYQDEEGSYRVAWGDDGVYKGERKYLSRTEVATKTTEITDQVRMACNKPDDESIQDDIRAEWIRSEHCALNKVILADLKKPDLRTADTAIKEQEETTLRYCEKLENGEHRDDEDYYPKSLPARRTL